MPKTRHIRVNQRGIALGLVLLVMTVMFTICMALYTSLGAEKRTSKTLVPRLAAQYLAESAVQIGILKVAELAGSFTRAVKQNKKGNDRYLTHFLADITGDRFNLDGRNTFRITELNLLTDQGKYSDKMVIMIKAEGKHRKTIHKIEKTIELTLGSF
ncbi:MAG: hypothetical protein QGH40_06210 [bacterium]|jgi:Tfp pilus assembly protein PilX|nr:hypothetical protein [bacterium]